MKICKIWDADYPWDIRVEKVATSLSMAGHSVHLVCRNLDRRVSVEHNGTFTVHWLPAAPRALGPLLRFADHIIVVVEESRDRLIRAGVSPDRLSVVCNTPRLEQWTRGAAPEKGGPCLEKTRAVYLGNLDGSRGIDVAIRAVHHLKGSGHRAALDVIGGGPSLQSPRAMASELDVADRRASGRAWALQLDARFPSAGGDRGGGRRPPRRVEVRP